MDLQLAAYKAKKRGYVSKRFGENPIPAKRATVTMANTRKYNEMLKKLRHSTWLRQEGHDKQLALLVNRRKFQNNATWQAEYDRLASQPGAPDGRLDQLKALIQGNKPMVPTAVTVV